MPIESLIKKIQKYWDWNDGSFSCFTLQKEKDLITVFVGGTENWLQLWHAPIKFRRFIQLYNINI